MKFSKIVAALLVTGALTVTTAAVAQQTTVAANDPTKLKTHVPKVSAQSAKSIQALQTAVNGNNAAAIPAALSAAQAAAKTADDRYFIGLLQLKAAAAAKDQTGIAASLEALLASGGAAPDEMFPLYFNLAQTYTTLKQYDRAAANYQKALDAKPNDLDAVAGLAEARASEGQSAAAIQLIQQGIKLQEAGGQKAPESWYKRAVSLAYTAKLPQAVDLSREWVQAYPSADSWSNAVAIYRNLDRPDAEATLDLFRLLGAQNAIRTPGEYSLYATAAAAEGNYTEAQAIIDQGVAAHAIDPGSSDFRDVVAAIKSNPKATDAGLAEATTLAKESLPLVHIGDRLAAMGEYAKAENAYRLALGKPGADPNLINLHLGMALARQGDKAGSAAALKAVTGPLAEVAQFWLTYLAARS
jgi:tetratricopeptide (TPR) repeat protein